MWSDLAPIEPHRLIADGRSRSGSRAGGHEHSNRHQHVVGDANAINRDFLLSLQGWKVTKFLPTGASGHVFHAVKNDRTKAALKVQIGDAKRLQNEIKTKKTFHREGLLPKILRHCSFNTRHTCNVYTHPEIFDERQRKQHPPNDYGMHDCTLQQ